MFDFITHWFLFAGALTGLILIALFWAIVLYFGIDELIGWFVDAPENQEGNER